MTSPGSTANVSAGKIKMNNPKKSVTKDGLLIKKFLKIVKNGK
jgi:hypothetical protein